MSEFTRQPIATNIFEGSDDPIEIVLRVNDDFITRYNNNNENKLKADQIIQKLTSSQIGCFFQKQKPDEKTGRAKHKIIIPLENDLAIEAVVFLWADKIDTFTELFSYRVAKFKEVSIFTEPKKNTIKCNCTFKFLKIDEKGGTNSEKFKSLYSSIEKGEIPVLDLNKEKDKQIWHQYVVALKKLVKQKEQVWKIKRVSPIYFEVREGDQSRAAYIDIFINEDDLMRQMEEDITELFDEKELEDYGVSDDKAFIEFKNYRQLNAEELSKLKLLGEELFYELSDKPPRSFLSGEIAFNYSTQQSKKDVFDSIIKQLVNDYQLEVRINDNGIFEASAEDFQHISKIVNENYHNLLSIKKNTLVELKVSFIIHNNLQELSGKVKKKLDGEDLTRSVVKVTEDKKSITVEVGAFIPSDKFSQEGLHFEKSISRLSPSKQIKPVTIDGIDLINGVYQLTNASKSNVENAIKTLGSKFPGVEFKRRPTLYYFKPKKEVPINKLRDFKTKCDLAGKTEFILNSSTLKVTATDESDYKTQMNRVKSSYTDVTIETKPYKEVYQVQFKSDSEAQRQSIVNKILNELRTTSKSKIKTDAIKNYNRLLFEYPFSDEETRDQFKDALKTSCEKYKDVVTYSFNAPLGQTIYELAKNQSLEIEKQKEIAGNVRQATFIYITPEQRQRLGEALDRFGAEARFSDGIPIGNLVKKDKDRLKFRLNDKFYDSLNAREQDRIEISEVAKGFIKPIFPGELTNIDRMIKAMKKVTEPGNKVGYPVNRNLPNFLFDPNEARQYATDIEEEKIRIAANLNEPLLKNQPKQLEAVTKAILSKDLALIQGPPGTGKTTVIAEIIWQALTQNPLCKILITSQTNLAVDNALERLAGKKMVRPLRIGNIDKFENEGKVYSNDRIKKWLQAKTESEEIEYGDNAIHEWIENIKGKCSTEEKYESVVKKWKDGLSKNDYSLKSTFGNAYYKYVNIFAATCSECGSRNFSEAFQSTFQSNSEKQVEPEFDMVIMDEASKATPPELVLPLTLGHKVIIIGDHKQLPPMIDADEFTEALEAVGALSLIENWTKDDYKVSQFEKLFKSAPKTLVASLDTQFRMHEQIMNTISQFYLDQEELDNGLICGIKQQMDIPDLDVKASRWHGIKSEPFIEPKHHAIWVNVETPEIKVGTSYENDGEVKAITSILKALTKASGFSAFQDYFTKDEEKEIGIITYYMPQMTRIKNSLYSHFTKAEWKNFEQNKFNNEFQIPFRINTVDRFQGMERNIIIISTVRSNRQIKEDNGRKIEVDNTKYPFALGFAKELQRVNVGFSRAKRLLIVVGNESHFSHKPEYAEAISKMHRVDVSQLQNLFIK